MKMQAGESLTLTVKDERKLDDCAYNISQAKKAIAWKLIEIGKELVAARAIFGNYNAEFLEWAIGTCGIGRTRCYECMQAFEKWGSSATLDGLSISAITLLSRDFVPEEARQQAIEESKSQPVTAKRAKEIVDERRMDAAGPPDTGSAEADDASELEPEDRAAVAVEDLQDTSPAPRQAKATGPVEPNQIGGAIRQVTGELEFAIENLADFQVAAVFEGVSAWMAAERERRGIKP